MLKKFTISMFHCVHAVDLPYVLLTTWVTVMSPGSENGFGEFYYPRPYTRCPPYIIGIGLGFILNRTRTRRVRLNPVRVELSSW